MYLFADIEAYSMTYYKKHNKIKEYVIAAKDLDDTFIVEDVSIDGWLDQIKELKTSATIYFHNMGGYDGHFIINPLMNKFGKKSVKYFMDEKNKIFEITATFRYRDYDDLNEKGKAKQKKVVLTFRDSWKIWPLSIASMGRAIGIEKKDYGEYDILDEFATMDEYKEHNDGKSYEYLLRDIDILVQFASLTNSIMPLSDYKLTMASTAMYTWKKSNQHAEKWIKWAMMVNAGNDEEKAWVAAYDDWREIKKAYKGGITYVKPVHQLVLLQGVYVYDINSMYPGIMLNKKLPYGIAIKDESKLTEHHSYRLYKVKIKRAKTEKMPFIGIPPQNQNDLVLKLMQNLEQGIGDNITEQTTYPTEMYDVEVYMNNYTFELFEKEYEGEWEKEFVLAYKEKYGQFDEYIQKFKGIKETSKGAIRELAKLFLNSLYGKFGQDIVDVGSVMLDYEEVKEQLEYTDKCVYLDGERVIINQGLVYKKVDNGLKRNISYIAMAEAITSKARVQLVEAINTNWESFVYCDTDSVHLLAPAQGIALHDTEFGDWAFEGKWTEAIYRRPKHYAHYGMDINEDFEEVELPEAFELKGGGFNVGQFTTIESMPKEKYIQEEFIVKNGKTNSMIVDGGVVIMDVDYKFTMPLNYKRGQNNEN